MVEATKPISGPCPYITHVNRPRLYVFSTPMFWNSAVLARDHGICVVRKIWARPLDRRAFTTVRRVLHPQKVEFSFKTVITLHLIPCKLPLRPQQLVFRSSRLTWGVTFGSRLILTFRVWSSYLCVPTSAKFYLQMMS